MRFDKDKTLFVSDMDGTLLGADSRLSPATVDNLNKAISLGANFTVATARTPATVDNLLRDVNLRQPAVLMTGSVLWHRDTNIYTHTRFLSPHAVESLAGIYREHGLPTFIYTLHQNKIHIYHIGEMSELECRFMEERLSSPFKEFDIPPCGTSELPHPVHNALLFYTMQPTGKVAEVYEAIRHRHDCNPVFYHDMYGPETGIMEVFSPEANKAAAVRHLAAQEGMAKVVAFGDNLNDIPMLKAADVAVAVENALPEVKEVADIVIGPNTSDSVSEFILNSCRDGIL